MLEQISAIIIDDEPDARNELNRIIEKELSNVEVISMESNAQTGLEAIIDHEPDIIFLDIQMPGKNGFWLADKLRKVNIKSNIIFVTAYDEYAIEAIRYAAFDFITKPIEPEAIRQSVTRYIDKKKNTDFNQKLEALSHFFNRDKIKFNNQEGFIMISPEDIVYGQADGNYTKLQLTNGKNELVTCQLGTTGNKLPEKKFLRISRSVLVNLDYLVTYNRKMKTVTLSDTFQEYELSVSSSGAWRLSLL